MKYVLAVDGGNSKTLAAVSDETGAVLSLVKDSGTNFQGLGKKAAGRILARVIKRALTQAGREKVDAACYGLAGADREKDFATFRELLRPLDPAAKSVLVNDTLLALRAGTADGVGVALIGGAGSNCIGSDRKGRIRKASGLGPLSGDEGSAGALVLAAIVAAMKGVDGRGPRTRLEDKFKQALGLEALEDIIEFEYADRPKEVQLASLAPLVFAAANEGDRIARQILTEQGQAVGEGALAVLRGLFSPEDEVPLVLGGSVLQRGGHPALVDAIKKMVKKEFPRVRLIVLNDHPLLGALLRGLDELGKKVRPEVIAKLRTELDRKLALWEDEFREG